MPKLKDIKSPCCNEPITSSLGDGVLIGSCWGCFKDVCRQNPKTGALEWLDGHSPWTSEKLRPMEYDNDENV